MGSPGTDADIKALFDSLQVKQEDSRAVLLATVPTDVLRKLAESPDQIPAAVVEPTPEQPAKPKNQESGARGQGSASKGGSTRHRH